MIEAQHIVGAGMKGYVNAVFRVRTFGLERLRLEPGTILASNHRSDNDVPVLMSQLYLSLVRAAAGGMPWPTFAADDHAFMRGFLAGYPEGLPLWARRVLWPIRVGGPLERRLQCVPVRQPTQMRLVELLRAEPERALDGRLPHELRARLSERAAQLGRPEPQRGSDVLDGAYADVLWTLLDRDETSDSDAVWRDHLRAAVGDFRRLAQALRDGGMVLIYPEGELSPDGDIGPLKAGLASLARRGHARLIQPLAICYDPLVRGRTRAYVSVAPAIELPPGPHPASQPRQATEAVDRALRGATPLTAGQLAAHALRAGQPPEPLAERLIARARTEQRPVDPSLGGPRHALAVQRAYARARAIGAEHPVVRRLQRELQSTQLR